MKIVQDTILLVEDNPNDVFLIQRAFRKANLLYPMQVAADGDAAVLYLSGTAPYRDRDQYPLPIVVLLDLKLPRRSGFEVLAWLKQQPQLQQLPVVILTASEEPPDVQQAYKLGANSYLVKPPTFADLEAMMQLLHQYWVTLNQQPEF